MGFSNVSTLSAHSARASAHANFWCAPMNFPDKIDEFDYLITFLAQKLAKFTKVEVLHEKCTGSCSVHSTDYFWPHPLSFQKTKCLFLKNFIACRKLNVSTWFLSSFSFPKIASMFFGSQVQIYLFFLKRWSKNKKRFLKKGEKRLINGERSMEKIGGIGTVWLVGEILKKKLEKM